MRVALLVVLLLVSAGCISIKPPTEPAGDAAHEGGPGDGGDTPSDGGAPGGDPETPGAVTSIPWALHDCSFYYATTQANADKVRQHLPDGFTIPDGEVAVAYEYNSCKNGTSMQELVEPMEYASVWVGVTPPDGGTPGVFSVVAFDVLIPDAERRAWLQDHGVAAHDGGLTAEALTSVAGIERVRLAWEMDSVGEFTIEYAAPQGGQNAGGTFDQWTGAELVYWKTDWQTSDLNTAKATVTVPEDSIYADWYAASPVAADLTFGTWDYTDGSISI